MSQNTLASVVYRDKALRELDALPPFSPVLNHLMASLANEDVSFAELASVIERDTVLSGNVLRLVNSALYGRRGTVSSVRAAISILGIVKLRKYVLGMSVSRLWAKVAVPPSWNMGRFNDHSVAVAILSDAIVQKAGFDYPEGAFAAGLLHDLGRLMIATACPAEYLRIVHLAMSTNRRLEEIETEVLGLNHAELSAAALQRWGLPPAVQKAVLYHHRSESDLSATGGVMPLSRAIELADYMAVDAGHRIEDFDRGTAMAPEAALRVISLEAYAGAIRQELETEFQTMRAAF
ncbi:MAG TPA: HDOD domain-containing protein [Bryobacteraceae bacterium]|nr:HDOD domain-containing protein [Bryobacteraceae bacterium]HPT28861.1 HDOD domain-containing protein [Bryobacteraceae bacterium]